LTACGHQERLYCQRGKRKKCKRRAKEITRRKQNKNMGHSCALKMGVANSSKMSAPLYQVRQHHIQEDNKLDIHSCENFISYKISVGYFVLL
jgi:hypothetical protein